MLKRKLKSWLKLASASNEPLTLHDFSEANIEILADFLRHKIGSKELNGIVTPDNSFYIPMKYIDALITSSLESNGTIDICDLIDATNLPGEILESVIRRKVSQIDGFFDVINRKFFTKKGARLELLKLIGSTLSLDLNYLLNSLYWTQDYLEAVLNMLTQNGEFIGYIDPLKQRLYNFTPLNFSLNQDFDRNLESMRKFIQTNFDLNSEVSLKDLAGLTRLSETEIRDLLRKHCKNITFLFSSDFKNIYNVLEIFGYVLRDIHVYNEIPIEFWLQRLDIDKNDFMTFLRVINQSLGAELSEKELKSNPIENWFNQGIDIEELALKLHLEPLQLLTEIKKFSDQLGLILITGEFRDPFLIKGIEEFEIFCQVDTSIHHNPQLYFECQNCRRIMCSNCRSSGSTHVCPFCGNISAFIIDLPRHCQTCELNYTHSFNLESTEECYFCKKGPLKSGWIEKKEILYPETELDRKLLEWLNTVRNERIPLREIISNLGAPDRVVIELLETHILSSKVSGKIDIKDLTLNRKGEKKGVLCSICETIQPEGNEYYCNFCKTTICINCYNKMKSVGMISCTECGSELVKFN